MTRIHALSLSIFIVLVAVRFAGPVHAQFTHQNAFPSLTFDTPVDIQYAPGDSTRLYVVDRPGIIYTIKRDHATSTKEAFLDICDRVWESVEEGLLRLAFHANYTSNGRFYVNYTSQGVCHTVVSRFTVSSDDPHAANAASEEIVLKFAQPDRQHNAGQLRFGPDRYLYIATGDGGGFDEERGTGEDLTTLLGSILRIDIDQSDGDSLYGIPPDNPFAGNTSAYREEIYSYGYRNPWRFSFDRADFGLRAPGDDAQIWIGDVGAGTFEEVNIAAKGQSHGWSDVDGERCHYLVPDCDLSARVMPLWFYWHGEDRAIIGGFVYRGEELPTLQGRYVFGDYRSGRIWALTLDTVTSPQVDELLRADSLCIYTFGESITGELYVGAMNPDGGGSIYRLTSDVVNPAVEDETVSGIVSLRGNHPNAFVVETQISYTLYDPRHVELSIYNTLGQRVRTFLESAQAPGDRHVRWNGTDDAGRRMPAGIYFFRMAADHQIVDSGQMVLIP